MNHELSCLVVILANAGNHAFQYTGLHGCPIKEFEHDGNSKPEILYIEVILDESCLKCLYSCIESIDCYNYTN